MSGSNILHNMPYWRLSGFYFLFFVTVGIFLPFWSLYLKSIGMNSTEIGILSSVLVFSKIFISYFWGWIVDHTGKRMRVIQVTSLFSFLIFAAALVVRDFHGLLLVLFLFSLFWSAALPQVEAATLSHLGEATHAYTQVRVWGSIGFILVVWILGLALDHIDIQLVPLFILISTGLVWLASLTIPELDNGDRGIQGDSIRVILGRPDVLALMAICFLMLFSHGPYYTFYSIYLEDNGYSRTFIGEMWALAVLAEVILFLFMQRIFRVIPLRIILLASLVLAMVRWLCIGFFIENIVLLVLAQLLHAATFGSFHAAAIQYIHRLFSGRLQGRGQALYSSISFGAGMALGSISSGLLWDTAGAQVCFTLAALITFVATLVTWVWIRD